MVFLAYLTVLHSFMQFFRPTPTIIPDYYMGNTSHKSLFDQNFYIFLLFQRLLGSGGVSPGGCGGGGAQGDQGKKMMHHCHICNRGFLNKSNIKVNIFVEITRKNINFPHFSPGSSEDPHGREAVRL